MTRILKLLFLELELGKDKNFEAFDVFSSVRSISTDKIKIRKFVTCAKIIVCESLGPRSPFDKNTKNTNRKIKTCI